MAEVVFDNLEGMLPELEELERQRIFSREELRIIIKRRTDFEYKLQKRIVEKEDILKYLEYEQKLNYLLTKRAKRFKLKLHSTACLSINKRVHTLFRKALMKFGDDVNLWLQYIEFCKRTNSNRAIGLAFGKLIQQHASNPDVWLLAAKYEFEEASNVENARSLMQRALRNHKSNKKLWLEYFRLELLHVDKIKKRRKVLGVEGIEVKPVDESEPKEMDQFLSNKTASIVFRNAVKLIENDSQFFVDFLNICYKFEDTSELEEQILQSLSTSFPIDELANEAICQRPITCLKRKDDVIVKDDEWIEAEEKMEKKFQEALEKVNTTLMWEKYLNSYAELLQDSLSPQEAKRRTRKVFDILSSAEKNKLVTSSMFTFWIDLLLGIGDEQEAMKCLCRAVDKFPHNVSMWRKYLALRANNTGSWEDLKADFKRCMSFMKKDDTTIWQMYIDSVLCLNNEETSKAFEDALLADKVVRNQVMPQYLKWRYETEGIKETRKLYDRLLKETVSYEFLKKVEELELDQDRVDRKRLRVIHEKFIDDFGKTRADVWLDYITFERKHGDEPFERVTALYSKAKKRLEGQLNSQFIAEYMLRNNQT